MATEKILNTRIQLKYDTLANWNASSFKLKAGELAIVTLGENKDGSTAGSVNQHPVLFKVGTGNHTFAELPFASALAADVYAWAKADDVVLAGKTIQFKNGDNVIKSITLNYITENEASTLISNALNSYSTTEQMNAAIKVEADRAKAAEAKIATFGEDGTTLTGGALFTEVNSLDGRIDTLESHVGDSSKGLIKDVADLKTAVGEGGSVDSKIANAIAGLDAEKSQAAGDDGLALSITEVDGKITTISGSIAANTYDAYGSAAAAQSAAESTAASALATARTEITAEIDADVKAEADRAKGVEAGLQSAIDTINNAESGILAQANAYTDGEIDKVEASLAKVVDGTTPVAKAVDADKLGGVAAASYATKAYADQAEADAVAAAKSYTDEVKNAILGDGIKETFDTLVEIQQWIEGDGVNTTELTTAITQEANRAKAAEEKIAKFNEQGVLVDGALFDEVNDLQGQINALGITDGKVNAAAKADVASSLDAAGIAQVKGIKVNNAINADKANSLTDDAKAEVKAVKVDNATNADKANSLTDNAKAEVKAVKVDNAAHADAASKVDNALTITTEDGTKVIYDGSTVKSVDLTGLATKGYADQAEADAKTYADGLAVNYATAAQGTKADSAVQSVKVLGETLTDGGELTVAEAKTALGLKSAAYTEASAYATAAQGTKADTAVQTVVGDTGLKATKTNTEVTVGFDPEVVFVFNCGSASTLID